MNSLPERTTEYAETKPEATSNQADGLLHFGDPATVARSLSRLARPERPRQRSSRRPSRNARVDGGAIEQTARAWLKLGSSACR